MSQKTEIILVRHGETAWNVEERMQGQLDSPLTKLGMAQTQAVAKRLQQETFTTLYSSDLGRAYQTAAAIAALTGHAIQTDERLREKHFGIIQGLRSTEIQSTYPGIYAERGMHSPDYVVPGGESTRQVLTRSWAALHEWAVRHPGERIVAVTHGGVISGLLKHVLGLSLEQPRRFEILNTSLHLVSYTDETWWVETLNDVHHLRNLPALDEPTQV